MLLQDSAMRELTPYSAIDKAGKYASIALALAPISDPYVFSFGSFQIGIMDLIAVIASAYILYNKRCAVQIPDAGLIVAVVCFFFCTAISFLVIRPYSSLALSIRVLIVWLVRAICFETIVSCTRNDYFFSSVFYVAIIGSICIGVQYVLAGIFGFSVWNGQLPLQLSENDGFSQIIDPVSGQIRPHAFFQEPSYFAIYCAPALYYGLRKRKAKSCLLISAGIILSTSFLGLVALILVVVCHLHSGRPLALGEEALCEVSLHGMQTGRPRQSWNIRSLALIFSVAMFAISFVILIAMLGFAPQMTKAFDPIIDKVRSILQIGVDHVTWRSSAQLRLLGNIDLYSSFSTIEKIFGIGANQASALAANNGVSGYSSTLVNTILNYGLVGLVILLVYLFSKLALGDCQNRFYPLFLMTCIFVDNIWFNWYFFYLLSWVLISNNSTCLSRVSKRVSCGEVNTRG